MRPWNTELPAMVDLRDQAGLRRCVRTSMMGGLRVDEMHVRWEPLMSEERDSAERCYTRPRACPRRINPGLSTSVISKRNVKEWIKVRVPTATFSLDLGPRSCCGA